VAPEHPTAEHVVAGTAVAPWHRGVTRYQWLVLIIACAGWVFDVYEGQIFNITREQLLNDLLVDQVEARERAAAVRRYGDMFLGVFLLGGTVGGIFFGWLADRWGRRPTMIVTILMYSAFSGLTYFAQSLWHVAALRFLVAMGVGGEWAVAAALVAEVFPARARANAGAIFHASSILGVWLAAVAGIAVGSQWRFAFLLGVAPALLVLWVRASVRESELWTSASGQCRADNAPDSFSSFSRPESLFNQRWRGRAVLGMLLAAVGLGTYWGVTVAGQDLAKEMLVRTGESDGAAARAKFAYGIIQATGGGLGLLAFGPICQRLGRRRAFVAFHVAALAIVPITCYVPTSYGQLLCLLPVFGFFTNGLHAGYAVYFPELFPTHLRATGAGFCFNGGRIVAAPMLWFSGWLKSLPDVDLRLAVSLLGLLFFAGIAIVLLLPETKDRPLPQSPAAA